MLIQIHILQNYAPSNLNRDDTGAPKDAFFGGVRRSRISSQCLKRSMRRSQIFEDAFGAEGLLGVRTLSLPSLVEEALKVLSDDTTAVAAITQRVPEIGRESAKTKEGDGGGTPEQEGDEEKESKTKQLIFISRKEIKPLAEKLLAIYQELGDKEWKKAKIGDLTKKLGASVPLSMDIAMFGRMTTSAAFEDVEAAVQVAHAISTNVLAEEFDYYTAIDDLSGEAGAGMIGDVEFNSSTYYKYINICWEDLLRNLGGSVDAARKGLVALLEAAVFAQPSGKQNSFAAFNLPDLVLVEVSQKNIPVSYANAFLKPAKPTFEKTIMEISIEKLASYIQKTRESFQLASESAYLNLDDQKIAGAQAVGNIDELKGWLTSQTQG